MCKENLRGTKFNMQEYKYQELLSLLEAFVSKKLFSWPEKELVFALKEFIAFDISLNYSYVLKEVSKLGYTKAVQLLFNYYKVIPSVSNNIAIRMASRYGHTELVKLLMSYAKVDPSDCDNYALKWAVKNGYTEIERLLLQDKRVNCNVSVYA